MKKYLVTLLLAPLTTWAANTVISTDTTYNGESFSLDADAILFVTDESNDPTLTFTNGSSASWEGATAIGASNGGSGHLEILGGSVLENNGTSAYLGSYGSFAVRTGQGYLGLYAGSVGTALVSGTGSAWNNSGSFFIGGSGSKGELRIENGGVVSNDIGYIASGSSSTEGLVTVNGAGSKWNNGFLYVGSSGKGELRIENGGVVSNYAAFIGNNSTSDGLVTVSGAGSKWENSGYIHVGSSGKGELRIENGGVVSSSGATHIGSGISGIGRATVTGQGSAWAMIGSLTVGYSGSNNTLTIEAGALVKIGGTLSISSQEGSEENYIRLDGGYLALSGNQETTLANFIAAERFQLWDEGSGTWMTGTLDDFLITYYDTNESGQSATGYNNLGGYTTITNLETIPEPTGILLLLFGMSVCLTRRREARGGRA